LTVILEAPASKPPEGSGSFVPMKTVTRRSGLDRLFRYSVKSTAFITFAILFLIGLFLFLRALPAFRYMGFAFFTTTEFTTNSTRHMPAHFGVLAALYGSVVIALVAVVIAVPVSIAAGLFVNEYAPRSVLGVFPLKSFLISLVDLMAAVPSIIYGLWGFFVLQPFMANISKWLSVHMAFVPIFRATPGTTVFTGSYFIAGTLVAIMIMPIVTSICREIFSLTPIGEREGAMALGATRSRVIGSVVLPFAKGGMVGAIMLGLGRALGEAVAVSIILSVIFGTSIELNSGGISIAALIALRFGSGGTYGLSALLACGFVLFVFTLGINLIASIIVSRSRVG
jgi:phosphate transport system permease protein